jgi:hypothetical protein
MPIYRVWILAAFLASSCASRSVPEELPPNAPASVKAKEAPLGSVTKALDEEPSLPVQTSTDAPHHHGGHHDH